MSRAIQLVRATAVAGVAELTLYTTGSFSQRCR
jgi:hypothetical protein